MDPLPDLEPGDKALADEPAITVVTGHGIVRDIGTGRRST